MNAMLPQLYNHLDAMLWRYATKSYNQAVKLDREILYALLEILRLTPTTMGLQLWRFVVLEDQEIRKQLVPLCSRLHADHQEHHIETASQVLIICRPKKFQFAFIDQHIEHVAYERGQSVTDLHVYSQNLHQWAKRNEATLDSWMDQQAFLALGSFIAACATARIDTCPLESFDKDGFDQVLKLTERHLRSVVACTIGVRNPQDKYIKEKKCATLWKT